MVVQRADDRDVPELAGVVQRRPARQQLVRGVGIDARAEPLVDGGKITAPA